MAVLIQFIYRLAFGLACGMAVTSPRQVTSGYFRNHLYVLMGLHVLVVLVAVGDDAQRFGWWIPAAGAVASYLGAVLWLYECPRAGVAALGVVAVISLMGAWQAAPQATGQTEVAQLLAWFDPITGGLVLGLTMAAMLLGHWYLNAPGMKLAPLQRLVLGMGGAVVLRAIVSAIGLTMGMETVLADRTLAAMLALRWAAGIVGTLVIVVMTWQTLKVPNTQSATGILYVGVITTFIGELTAQLLSQQAGLPL